MSVVPAHVPEELVHSFDFRLDPRIERDPWSLFASAASLPPVFWSPDLGGHWVLARAARIEEAWMRPDLFSAKSVSVPRIDSPFRLIPNNLDPPEHRAYQQIFTRQMFAPRIIEALTGEFRRMTRDRIESFARDGRVDFSAEYARPLPVQIFLSMLGISPDRRREFDAGVERVFRGTTSEDVFGGMTEVAGLLDEWLDQEIQEREAPRDAHVLQAMLRAEIDGRRLEKDELTSMATMLMLAGLDTVTSATLHQVLFLATHPRHLQELIEEPARIPNAVEELLRRFSAPNLGRIVARDCHFAGVEMRAGDMVLFSTTIAGLDPERFANPLEVDFGRAGLKGDSLSFGTGIHMCSGHALARRELAITLEELLPRLPNLRLGADAEIRYASGGTLTIASPVPLEWDA